MGSSSISPSSVIVSYASLAFVLVILFLICQNSWDFAPPVFISLSARSRVFSLISFSSCSLSTFWLLMYFFRIVVFSGSLRLMADCRSLFSLFFFCLSVFDCLDSLRLFVTPTVRVPMASLSVSVVF